MNEFEKANVELEKTLAGILNEWQKDPEMSRILSDLKTGKMSEEEALLQLMDYTKKHPEIITDIMNPEMAEASNNALFKSKEHGLPRLNPLVEGALIERVQFDDDIPELRTGHLPEGVKPAVSVKTTARDPVAIGKMLNTASNRVMKQIKEHEEERRQALTTNPDLIKSMISQAALVKLTHEEAMEVALHGSAETDLPEYQRGVIPAPMRSRRPSGSALAKMTPQERKEKAFKFFSTTQGRRSAIPVIRELIAIRLQGEGLEVEEQEFDPKDTQPLMLIAFHQWSVMLGGEKSTQATFSVIDVAASVLAKVLIKQLQEKKFEAGKVILEVVPVNEVDTRVVGWAARLLPAGKGLVKQ